MSVPELVAAIRASDILSVEAVGHERATPSATAGRAPRHSWYGRVKPALERLLAVLGLAFFAPVFLLVAFLIKCDSAGPALYRQVRVGRDRRRRRGSYPGPDRRRRNQGGQPFRIVKFRTMRLDAEAGTGPVWARGSRDPRVTRLGKLLRASHIDELAQLVNVLRGEMSLVGPRPERPEFFVGLAVEVPQYAARTAVRPGITGLAQVRHKYDETLDDVRRKVELDLEYIEQESPLTDLKILIGTLRRCWHEYRKLLVQRRRQARAQRTASVRN